MARSKNAETGQIVIRPPAGMRDRIKAAAEANNRSMNAEIVATLEEAYPALSPDMHQVTFEVLQLLGLLTIMTKEDRELSVREKEQELRLRGAQCEMSLHDNTLRLTMAGGDIKYEFGLPEPFPDNLPDD